MLSKQADCLSYFIDYQLIVFFDSSLTKRWSREVSFCTTAFSPFFGFIWQMEWRFCPCRAWLIASLSSGRCPGLCAAAPAGRRITICEYGGTSTIKKLIKVTICNSYLCRLCIVFGLRYLWINFSCARQSESKLSLHSLAKILNKIGGTRKCKEKQVFLCHFTRLHYLCRKNGFGGYKRTRNESILHTETDKNV